jgi:hypothetical protein
VALGRVWCSCGCTYARPADHERDTHLYPTDRWHDNSPYAALSLNPNHRADG